MRSGVGVRRRVAIAFGLVLTVGGFALVPAAPATADTGAANIWVGPGCPGSPYECQASGSVTQSSDLGRNQKVVCTLDVCNITQSNHNAFSNDVEIRQAKTLTSSNTHRRRVDQVATQSAMINQTSTGLGTNTIRSFQKINESATENLNTPVTHRQEGHQLLDGTQDSEGGAQNVFLVQSLDFDSTVHAPQATQRQNADDNEGAPDQDVKIRMTSDSGANTVAPLAAADGGVCNADCRTQFQLFRHTATGPLQGNGQPNNQGFNGAQQIQGHPNDPAARMETHPIESSSTGGGVTTNALKDWDRTAPTPKPNKSNQQFAYDELVQILGKLSPSVVDGSETSVLGDEGTRICIQDLEWHSESASSEGTQSCPGSSQTVTGPSGDMHLEVECTPTEGGEPTAAQEGCSTNQAGGLSVSGQDFSATADEEFDGVVATVRSANAADDCNEGSVCPLTATIDWGDGTDPSAGTISGPGEGGSFDVRGTHTYGNPDQYTVTITVSKPTAGVSGSDQSTATVSSGEIIVD